MPNRTRTHDLRVYLSDDEYRILEAKTKLANMHSRSAFIRQLIIEGIVYDVDYSYLREYNYQLGRIGNNINQIAHRANTTGSIYKSDIDQLKKEMQEIWRLQKSMLSQQPFLTQ